MAASSSTRYFAFHGRIYDLEEATSRSRASRLTVDLAAEKNVIAGCYACGKMFLASSVVEFLSDPERPVCPECLVDAVLINDPSFPVNEKILAACRRFYFW